MIDYLLNQPLLSIVILLSASLAIAIALPATSGNTVKALGLGTSLVALLIGTLSCLSFDKAAYGFQFLYTYDILPQYSLTFTLGADGLSIIFLLLTLFVFPICILAA
jgi:NADH-quinone oxidoreductase subunit M